MSGVTVFQIAQRDRGELLAEVLEALFTTALSMAILDVFASLSPQRSIGRHVRIGRVIGPPTPATIAVLVAIKFEPCICDFFNLRRLHGYISPSFCAAS